MMDSNELPVYDKIAKELEEGQCLPSEYATWLNKMNDGATEDEIQESLAYWLKMGQDDRTVDKIIEEAAARFSYYFGEVFPRKQEVA